MILSLAPLLLGCVAPVGLSDDEDVLVGDPGPGDTDDGGTGGGTDGPGGDNSDSGGGFTPSGGGFVVGFAATSEPADTSAPEAGVLAAAFVEGLVDAEHTGLVTPCGEITSGEMAWSEEENTFRFVYELVPAGSGSCRWRVVYSLGGVPLDAGFLQVVVETAAGAVEGTLAETALFAE